MKKMMFEKAKKSIFLLNSLLFLCVCTVSCSSDEGTNEILPVSYNVSGKVEKGPYISGSTITIQPMNERLQVMGEMYSTTINDDLGNFTLGSREFQSPYAELMANGYFFNEVAGTLSNGTLTLRALADLSDGQTVNVNVLTHLKYARIRNLIASGSSFKSANQQAQRELLIQFGLEKYSSKDASQFSIIAGTDESAALIAISSMLLMGRSEAAFTEYLSKISEEFGRTGTFSETTRSQIRKDKEKLFDELADIKENIVRRYEDLGIDVEVKDLEAFVDWNDNGIVGDEFLKDGEKVELECTEFAVPNNGGTYNIKINSPVPVYLERQVENSDEVVMQPDFGIVEENLFNGLYDKYDLSSLGDKEITLTKSLENNILTIVVSPLASNTEKKTSVPLYDYVGNVVATVSLTQEAGTVEIPAGSVPKLGKDGEMAVASFALSLLRGMQSYSFVEQAYWSNQETGWASRITSGDTDINKAWSNLYKANSQLLNLREIDERYLNVYGDFCSVLSAISYSTLLYGWGGVPYVVEYSQYENAMSGIPRTSEKEILIDLQKRLLVAIENLEEKKNESLGDINGLFFVSKDVARVLLANLYMYERRYSEAAPLLNQVIDNGFYSLDASTDFKTSPELDVEYTRVSVEESTEVIFALSDQGATTRVVIQYPGVMPYITLSDVYLSLAECLYHTGNEGQAEDLLEALVRAKSLMLIEKDTLLRIKEVRERLLLYSGTYFAFLKRNNLAKDVCGIEDYRLLFPVPSSEMMNNMMMTQNPGY